MRDSPAARRELLLGTYRRPVRGTTRELPYRRAANSFMAWEGRRGILNPPDHAIPGSPWWRAVNERLLQDGCEAVARLDGFPGAAPTPSVARWVAFMRRPSARRWWVAHNASIVGAYLEHRALADRESLPERFFMNVVLLRVLYAHALIGNPRLALGWWSPLGRLLGDPRLGMTGVFLSLSRVLPDRYPLTEHDIAPYLAAESGFGRALDYGVIAPRLTALYTWSADALDEPRLLELLDRGLPSYAWPASQAHAFTAGRPSRLARTLAVLLPVR